MNKVILRPLAIHTLAQVFARPLEGNKIRHYSVGMAELAGRPGETALEIVKRHIAQQEGELTEFEVQEYKPLQNPTTYQGMQITPATGVLKDDPEIETALKQQAVKSTLLQYNELYFTPTRFQKALGYLTRAVNRFILQPINQVIYNHFRIKFVFDETTGSYFGQDTLEELDVEAFNAHLAQKSRLRRYIHSIPQIRLLPSYETQYVRRVTPAMYLTVSYEEGQEEVAFDYLRDDLEKLYQTGGLMGHLAMPSICLLADTVGDGKQKAAAFAFVFVDLYKVAKSLGQSYEEFLQPMLGFNPSRGTESYLAPLGLKTLTPEGAITSGLPGLEKSITEIEYETISTVHDTAHAEYVKALAPLYLKAAERYEEKEAAAKAAAKKPE